MSKDTNITANFSLLRWMNGTHKTLVERLSGVSNWTKLSGYVLAKEVPTPYMCTSVESALKLPRDWMSRDNVALINMSAEDYKLVTLVLATTPQVKKALYAFTSSLNGEA